MFCFSCFLLSLFTCVPLLISPVHISPSFSVTLCQFICCALSNVSVWFSPVSFVSLEVLPAPQELFVFYAYFLFFCSFVSCRLPFGFLHFDICILYLLGYQLIIKAFLFFYRNNMGNFSLLLSDDMFTVHKMLSSLIKLGVNGEISSNYVSGLRPALPRPPRLLLAIIRYVRLDMLSGPFK